MDAATAAALIMGLQTVGKPAAEAAKELIVRLLGPTTDLGGDALKHWVHAGIARGHDTVVTAGAIVEQAGLGIRPVPGRILIPILEHSSLEEDESLRAKWAALLANAATQRDYWILPAYAEILRQLTPKHVAILDWIYENAQQPSDLDPQIIGWRDVKADEVSYRFGLNTADYQIHASDLHRLQVIDGRRYVQAVYGRGSLSSASTYDVIGLTPLGAAFIRACRPPAEIAKTRAY